MIKLKIGGVPEHFNLPWRLAMEEGLFRNKGIHLHWEDMGGGTGQMIRGLENKTLDVAVLLTEGISKVILQGLDAKIIQVYVSSPLKWGIHVPFHSDINEIAQLKNQSFAISRTGSGSHLMTYILADQQGWSIEDLKFNVVGDIYGGLWALENNKSQAFLWEKFTTEPYVELNKCRYIGEVVTPWPCFCIAVRNECFTTYKKELNAMCKIVNERALKLKNDNQAIESISWRYGLKMNAVRQWLNQTEWNYEGKTFLPEFQKVVKYLVKLGLIEKKEARNFQQKLF